MKSNDFEVSTLHLDEVVFFPEGHREIFQNIAMILSTIKGSLPLDRDFGISAIFLDAPTERAKALLRSEIIDAVQKYEPRAEIISVKFSGDINGKIYPTARVRVKDGY